MGVMCYSKATRREITHIKIEKKCMEATWYTATTFTPLSIERKVCIRCMEI